MTSNVRGQWAFLIVLSCVLHASGQNPPSNAASFHRVVSIPVTVTGAGTVPVRGLPAGTFRLIEGGQRRALSSADEVGPLVVGPNKTKVAFIVFDALGTPWQLQSEARKRVLQLLADSVVNGLPIMVAEISPEGLQAVHDLSTPAPVLAAALLRLDAERRLLSSPDKLKNISSGAPEASLVTAEAQRLRQFREGSRQQANMMRTFLAQMTAFRNLTGALSGAKGRKTVVWLTEYFPVEINDADNSINIDSFGSTGPFPVKTASIDYQKTLDLLNEAQVTVFTACEAEPQQRTIIGLDQFARSTGGQLLRGFKTLKDLVQKAEGQTDTYYILKFEPGAIRTGIKWSKLRIEVGGTYTVRSPNGLFVFAPNQRW